MKTKQLLVMMLIVKLKYCREQLGRYAILKKFYKCNLSSPIGVRNENPQIINALSKFGSPNKIGYSFPLEMPKHNPSHSRQHPICLPNSIFFKISSDLHHPPSPKPKILVLDCISLRDTWHNRNNFSSFRKNYNLHLQAFILLMSLGIKNCNELTTQTHQTTRKKLSTQLPKLQKSFST